MAEYIEREAFRREIDEHRPGRSYEDAWALTILDFIPAADVRPVVTCGECKHNNACLTQAFVEEESKAPFDRNTFFCADGERGSCA